VSVGLTEEATRRTLVNSMDAEGIKFRCAEDRGGIFRGRRGINNVTRGSFRDLMNIQCGMRTNTRGEMSCTKVRRTTRGGKFLSCTCRASTETRVTKRDSIFVKCREKSFRSQSGQDRIINQLRIIKRSHGIIKILTKNRKATMEALSKLKKEIPIRDINTREYTKIDEMLP